MSEKREREVLRTEEDIVRFGVGGGRINYPDGELAARYAARNKNIAKYGVSVETLRGASGCNAETVVKALETGVLSDKANEMRLSNILGWLSDLCFPYFDNSEAYLYELVSFLGAVNGVSAETIAKYADIAGVDGDSLDQIMQSYGKAAVTGETSEKKLTAEQEYRVFRVASLLNGVLNKSDPFPWL